MSFRIDKHNALGPDGASSPWGLEVVFVDDIPGPTHDRQPDLQFQPDVVQQAIQRGRDFEALFPCGVLQYVTNSRRLAEFYIEHFRANGLENYTFVIIPAVWGGP